MLPPSLAADLCAIDTAKRTPTDTLAKSQAEWKGQADELRRRDPQTWRKAQHMPSTAVPALLTVARQPRLSRNLPRHVRTDLGLLTARPRASRGRPVRQRGSRRASSATRAPPDDDPPFAQPGESARRTCDCGSHIFKPARGPWPTRCVTCWRAAEIERKCAQRKRARANDFASTAEGRDTIRFLIENSRSWQEIAVETLEPIGVGR